MRTGAIRLADNIKGTLSLLQPTHCAFCGGLLCRPASGPAHCFQCHRVAYEDPKLAAACIISIDGRLVLVKRAIQPKIGKWSFPSGYVNRGEQVEQAAQREVLEETALSVHTNWLVGLFSEPDSAVVLAVYDATVVDGRPRAGDETTEVGLFEFDDLPELAFEHDACILRDWRAERRRRGIYLR